MACNSATVKHASRREMRRYLFHQHIGKRRFSDHGGNGLFILGVVVQVDLALLFAVFYNQVVMLLLVVLEVNGRLEYANAENIHLDKSVVAEQIQIKINAHANISGRQIEQ